jgi:mono/diheme cytochrome c family protein
MDTTVLSPLLLVAGIGITGVAIYLLRRTPRPAITPFLGLLGLGLLSANLWLLFAPTGNNATLPTNPLPASPERIAQGQVLYNENCLRCHGENLDGQGPEATSLTVRPANLRQHVPFHEDGYHFNVITNGFGGMPALGETLTEEERWTIIHYLREATRADAGGEHGGGEEHEHDDHSHE